MLKLLEMKKILIRLEHFEMIKSQFSTYLIINQKHQWKINNILPSFLIFLNLKFCEIFSEITGFMRIIFAVFYF